MHSKIKKWLIVTVSVAAVGGLAAWPLYKLLFKPSGPGVGFVSGNGRIEATEIDVATKLAGRIDEILVAEGEFVELGQTLVRMNIDVLKAQREEAIAQSKQASAAVTSAQAQVTARQSDTAAAIAMVGQRDSELDVANRTIARIEKLLKTNAASMQEFDDDNVMLLAPTTHFVMLAQAILFRGADIAVVWPQFLALLLIGGVFFVVSAIQFRKSVAQSG